MLLAYGADVNATGPTGHATPLHLAAAGGYSKIVSLLLNSGASLNALDAAGFSALEISLLTANDDVYQTLLAELNRRRRDGPLAQQSNTPS